MIFIPRYRLRSCKASQIYPTLVATGKTTGLQKLQACSDAVGDGLINIGFGSGKFHFEESDGSSGDTLVAAAGLGVVVWLCREMDMFFLRQWCDFRLRIA